MVRFAEERDLDRVIELLLGLAAYGRQLEQADCDRERLRHALFGPEPRAEALVAERPGRVVGVAVFTYNFSTFRSRPGVWLEALFVEAGHRGAGVGRALMRRLAAITLERDCARLEWAVQDDNTRAVDFYLRVGARLMDEWSICHMEGWPLRSLARATTPHRVRFAREDEVGTVVGLILGLADYERLRHEADCDPARMRRYLFQRPRRCEALLAEWDGQPVGLALFFENFWAFRAQPGMWLEDLYVPPEHRGKGLGRALLETLASVAVERGCARLEWTVLDWNTPSIRFYRRIGAYVLPDWTIGRLEGATLEALAAAT